MTSLVEPSKYTVSQAEVAWLEKALYLAAKELEAFRTNAQAERERARHALDDANARLRALEAERSEAERRHAVELEGARARFDAELTERAAAWSELGDGVAERNIASTRAYEQWQAEAERSGRLLRELHEMQLQLTAAQSVRESALAMLATLEASFVTAAVTTREAKEQGAGARAQVDRLCVELDQSMVRCRQLEQEASDLASKLSERNAACDTAERALAVAEQESAQARARSQTLEHASSQLEAQREELERERVARRAATEQLDRAQHEFGAAKRKAEDAQVEVAEAKRLAELAQADLQGVRRERDQSKRELETELKTRLEAAQKQLDEALRERDQSKREFETELKTRLEAAQKLLDEAQRDSTRNEHERDAQLQAELETTRKDRDDAQRDRARLERERVQRAENEARLQLEVETIRAERDEAQRELADHAGTRMAMLDTEKERVTKLKAELEELKGDLERTRSERETMRDELAQQQRVASGQPPNLESLRVPQASPTRIEREQQMTVPIVDRPPANEVVADPASARRQREGTAYSVTEVQEEQVFSRKGGGGGRGTR